MTVVCSMASFGSSVQVRHGATCRKPLVPAPPVTIASFGGGRPGVWDQIMDALAAGHDAAVQMIDTSVVRVHQHGACVADNNHQDMGRSRGGLTSKIHAVVDTNGQMQARPLAVAGTSRGVYRAPFSGSSFWLSVRGNS